jgi:RNA polymerase sigma-70 factor (ECF subfamily)
MHGDNDTTLIKEALDGSQAAFGSLVERHLPMVAARVAPRIAGYHDRQEVVQEVFLRAHAQLTQLREPERFPAWLGRIADNVSRRWQRRAIVQGDLFTGPSDDQATEAASHKPDLAIRARLATAMARLSARHREALYNHYVDRFSYQQMALTLACGPDVVRSRLQKARNQLKKEIQKMTKNNETHNIITLDRVTARALQAACGFRFRADRDNIKKRVVSGILLEKLGTIASTDGRRLLIRHCPALAVLAADVVLDNCDAEDFVDVDGAELAIGVTEAVLRRTGGTDVVFPLIAEAYPDYRMVVPEERVWQFRVRACQARNLFNEIEPCLAPRHPQHDGLRYEPVVELVLDVVGGKLSLATRKSLGYHIDTPSAESGLADLPDWEHSAFIQGAIDRNEAAPDELVMHINFEYLRDAVAALDLADSDTLDFDFLDKKRNVVIRPTRRARDMAVLAPFHSKAGS